jgi:hypothetical protein
MMTQARPTTPIKPHYILGDSQQPHGFVVDVVADDCTVAIYCPTAEEARNASYNVQRQYTGVREASIHGY